jgi:hypothetical protein
MTNQPKVHTWEVQFDPTIGYKLNTNTLGEAEVVFPDVPPQAIIPAISPDPVMPTAKQWWCVISEEGLGTIYGPYLTQAAAQSLIDEGKANGSVQAMNLA